MYQAHPTPYHTLVHIGAGATENAAQYRTPDLKRAVLIEPTPSLITAVTEEAAEQPNAEILQKAVSDRNGRANLSVFNLNTCNSLRKPTGISAVYPGLKEIEKVKVSVVAAGELISSLNLAPDERHRLVIHAPGEELSILRSLVSAKKLRGFEAVSVYCGNVPLYENGPSADDICKLLYAEMFHIQEIPDAETGPAMLNAIRNEARIDNERLKSQLEALKAELVETERRITLMDMEIAKSSAQLEMLKDLFARETVK